MRTLLVLAINKMRDGDFLITALDRNENSFFNIKVESDYINSESEVLHWDIFGITECDLIRGNLYYTVRKPVIFKGHCSPEEVKALFGLIKGSIERFSSDYCRDTNIIVSARKVNEILYKRTDGGTKSHEIKFISGGKEYSLPIIDDRWRTYWDSIDDKDMESEKKRILEVLGEKQSQIFLILYRYVFGKTTNILISAIHYL